LVCTDMASPIAGIVKFRRLEHAKLCKTRQIEEF